ncbi:myb/SANT-like DNA-binding domain-containing protein 4 [Episyrphus balteatus]|uniref:myb/SANT-like DNA-binding domain-containing protein 4 n=1 Tax=Episyrphus balteatus TaxID=286459 RepID=UPI002485CF8F|nr:myb/SANT-like DNA-binding domain-containing protein 4 [Episyrphus balteatus]XP_055843689.1 myb/SANT-like DNA-binding domain-containing protein 4 [Episyrphus balteatus]
MSEKIKRSSRFSEAEEKILIALILEKRHIFENKKTDAFSSKLKDKTWEEVAQRFNSSSLEEFRTPRVLKEKYNNLKRLLRRKQKQQKRGILEVDDNDDDEFPPKKKTKENLLQDLNDVICSSSSADGIESRLEGDGNDDNPIFEEQICDQIDYKEETFELVNDDYTDEDEEASAENANDEETGEIVEIQINDVKPFVDYSLITKHEPNDAPNPNTTKNNNTNLKEQILKQQLHHASLQHEQKMQIARLEHKQRMQHLMEEHKMKIRVLEAELRVKKSLINFD